MLTRNHLVIYKNFDKLRINFHRHLLRFEKTFLAFEKSLTNLSLKFIILKWVAYWFKDKNYPYTSLRASLCWGWTRYNHQASIFDRFSSLSKMWSLLWAESFDVGQDLNLNLTSFERLYQSIQSKINHCITYLSPTASWLIKSIEVSLTSGRRNSLPSVTKTR